MIIHYANGDAVRGALQVIVVAATADFAGAHASVGSSVSHVAYPATKRVAIW